MAPIRPSSDPGILKHIVEPVEAVKPTASFGLFQRFHSHIVGCPHHERQSALKRYLLSEQCDCLRGGQARLREHLFRVKLELGIHPG